MIDEDQFKFSIKAMNQNTQLPSVQLLKQKPDFKETNNPDSSKIPVIKILHTSCFENFDPKKENFKCYEIMINISKITYDERHL